MTRSKIISPFPSGPTRTPQIFFLILISAVFCPFPSLQLTAEDFLVSNQEYILLPAAFCGYGMGGGSNRNGPKIRFLPRKLPQLRHPFGRSALDTFLGEKVYSFFLPNDSLNLSVVLIGNPV